MELTEAKARFLRRWRDYRGATESTLANYSWALEKLPSLPATADDIVDLIGAQHLAPSSRRQLWVSLRVFCQWMSATYEVPDPMAGLKPPKARPEFPRSLEVSELDLLLTLTRPARDLAIVMLAADTGCRLGELANLTWRDVGSETITVSGKTGPRTVPVGQRAREALTGLGDDQDVWIGRGGRPLTRSGVEQVVRRSLARAGFRPPKAGPHLLRHTFAKLYVMGGGDAFTLQRILGHASVRSTQIYVNMNPRELIEAHRKYSAVGQLTLPGMEAEGTTRLLPLVDAVDGDGD